MVRLGVREEQRGIRNGRKEVEDGKDRKETKQKIQMTSKSKKPVKRKKAMEENRKLTYEELSQALGDLHVQYQKLAQEYQKALEALRNRDFDYTSFFLSMLFKVMDHPEMYNDDFVNWATRNIETALRTFADTGKEPDEEKGNEAE